MLNLQLPDSSIPKWGAMLSDQDFLSAVRQTIQPKLDLVDKSSESISQSSTPTDNSAKTDGSNVCDKNEQKRSKR